MKFIIDDHNFCELQSAANRPAADKELRREGRVFFVGGSLPIHATLETMFESYCTESTDVFLLTFGAAESLQHGLEMTRAIKKNFNIRLMVRLKHNMPAGLFEHAYAAGADLIDIPGTLPDEEEGAHTESLQAAGKAFPRWSAASTIVIDGASNARLIGKIDELLSLGIVPLPWLSCSSPEADVKETHAVLRHLTKSWQHHRVAIKPYLALIRLFSPLVPADKPGALRSLFERIQDRQKLAASDLLRHLRVQEYTDSLDSAGL